MQAMYVSIEKNIEAFELYKKLWGERGIIGVRVDNMSEGIEMAVVIEKSKTDYLYFIDIVADDIDYIPQLAILNAEIKAPIFIAASLFNGKDHDEAIKTGAHSYGQYRDKHEENITSVMIVIERFHQTKEDKTQADIRYCNGILVSLSERTAYFRDVKIMLSEMEFNLLFYFMCNRGRALTFEVIYNDIWDGVHNETDNEAVKTVVKKLRKKISRDVVENLYGKGYRMPL